MYIAHRWGDRNLSRMELVIAILVLAILAGVFSRHMLIVFAKAEQSMINSTIINFNTTLNYRAALAFMKNKYHELELLETTNPMKEQQVVITEELQSIGFHNLQLALMASTIYTPLNYAGEVNSLTMDSMEKGKWYFNQDNQHIIYKIRNTEFFSNDVEGSAQLQFRVVIDYDDANANGRYDPEVDDFKMMKLESVNHYQWHF
tara:strand:- start:5476 stop:6084 length:609 start_codon:yes stop_codon:yes gene_type:complete